MGTGEQTVEDKHRDSATPPEVDITMEAREPQFDPTLGVKVPVRPVEVTTHRLVTIGDSLSHGFQSGAIYNTELSYPAIIAWELGWFNSFRFPTYHGYGGLPLNLEFLIRVLESKFGAMVSDWELPLAYFVADDFTRPRQGKVEKRTSLRTSSTPIPASMPSNRI